MAFRKIFLNVNPDISSLVTAETPDTAIGLTSKLPAYYLGETVIFCISFVSSTGSPVPYINTDTFDLSVDNNFIHSDELMAHTSGVADGTDSKVNVPGDWANVSPASGKLSIRVDFNTIPYSTKIAGSESIQVRTEIKKYDAGSEAPAIILQTISTARNVVNNGEEEPQNPDPNYLTAAQTRALAAAEAGNLWKTGAGVPVYSAEKVGDMYLNTSNGDVYQVKNVSDVLQYVLVDNIQGPAGQDGEDGEDGEDGAPGPQGPQGPQGPAGTLTEATAWDASTAYSRLAIVTYLNETYQCIASDVPAGTLPTDTTKFIKIAAKGADGQDGTLTQVYAWDSSTAYSRLAIVTYLNETYQCIASDVPAGTLPTDTTKFIKLAAKGADGQDGEDGEDGQDGAAAGFGTPSVTTTTTAAGTSASVVITPSGPDTAKVFDFDFSIPRGADGQDGEDGQDGQDGEDGQDGNLIGSSESVSALVSGKIRVTSEACPVTLKTNAGNIYPIEKGSLTSDSSYWYIDPAPYLAYDGAAAFTGPWTVYFAGGLPEVQTIIEAAAAITPQEHQTFRHTLASGDVLSIVTSSLTATKCMTFEIWLDMPSTVVSFTWPEMTWIEGAAPAATAASTRYVVTVRWNGTKLLANLAYTEALV